MKEIQTLHPRLSLSKTSIKLATAQGSSFTNYGKFQLYPGPTQTMEQNKLLNKPFKQTSHITDIKHNFVGLPLLQSLFPLSKY